MFESSVCFQTLAGNARTIASRSPCATRVGYAACALPWRFSRRRTLGCLRQVPPRTSHSFSMDVMAALAEAAAYARVTVTPTGSALLA